MSLSKITVIGFLGKDATVNTVGGKSVINFNLAHTTHWTDAQGVAKEKTLWHECAYWTDKTKVAEYMKKGGQIYVEGEPDVRAWTSNDGKSGVSLTVRVFSVQLLGSKPADSTGPGAAAAPTDYAARTAAPVPAGKVDDLPF